MFPFGLNEERLDNTAVLYTAAVGPKTRTSRGVDLILARHATNTWLPLRAGRLLQAQVQELVENGNASLTPDTMVLSLGPDLLTDLTPPTEGQVLQISTATFPDVNDATTAIGGGPALARDAQAVPRDEVKVRNPRTALGWNREFFYLVQVDGRQRRVSVGMTTEELANYMLRLGCDTAMSLDGGGSATCWVHGLVMNRPSEGFERAMANALYLVRKKPSE
jgi:hypothetical protein